jgi:hypothetical protein
MKARLSIPTALAVLAVIACEPPGPRPPAAVNHVHTTPTPALSSTPAPPATAAPSPTQTAAAPSPTRCHTAGLQVAFTGSEGAAGTIVDSFRLRNIGTSPCTIYGFVGMQMLDASGRAVATRVVRNGGLFSTQAGPARFLLQPGTAASFQVAWSDVPHGVEGPCAEAASLVVTPPDEFDHRVISVSGWNLAPCAGGELDVTPIRAAGAG